MTKAFLVGKENVPCLSISPQFEKLLVWVFSLSFFFRGCEVGREGGQKLYLTLIPIYMTNNRPSFWFISCVLRKYVLKQTLRFSPKKALKWASCCINMSGFIPHTHWNDQHSSLFSKVLLQPDCWLKTTTQPWSQWVSEYFFCSCRV